MPCIARRARPLVLHGTLTTFRRRCGKPACRCATGEPHESPALTYTEDGRTKILTLSAGEVEEVRAACGEWGFGLRLLTSHRVFFEVLSVYEAARRAGEEHAARSEERKAAVGMHGPGSPAPIARVTN